MIDITLCEADKISLSNLVNKVENVQCPDLTPFTPELLETIKEFTGLYDCKEFKTILHYLRKKGKELHGDWWALVRLADGKDTKDNFYNTLTKIRNTGTYHYKHTKCINQGLKYYIEKNDDVGYISMGDTLGKTRFYFGGAAIQYYHRKITDEFGPKFHDTLADYTKKVNILLRFILEIYLTQILKVV